MGHSFTSVLLIVALLAFALFRRTQRTLMFQPLRARRMTTRIVILSLVAILVLAAGALDPMSYLYDLAGAIVGAILARYAMRTTKFERRSNGWYYKPNPWIGVILLVLFIGRLADRFYMGYGAYGSASAGLGGAPGSSTGTVPAGFPTTANEPWTMAIYFTLFAYYVVYYIFLMRKEKHLDLPGVRAPEDSPENIDAREGNPEGEG